MLDVNVITPVEELIVNPAVDENIPPVVKPATNVGEGFVPFAQTGVEYENPVMGEVVGLIVIDAVFVPASWQPDAGIV